MTTPAAPARAAPLDDVMLAMDVVDTLRHQESLVAKELGAETREQDLLERLKKVYAAQGIDVPDRILKEGVTALREGRFTYTPPADSLQVRLARAYVHRGRYGRVLLGVLVVAALAVLGYRATVVAPRQALERDLAQVEARIVEVARVDEARARAATLGGAGAQALVAGDTAAARTALEELRALGAQLELAYTLEIVSRPNETTGVWRVPEANPQARNYYLIVEAVAPDGRVLSLPIRNEETGATSVVRRWGLRVDETTFQRVAADKADDGIIQDRVFGEKRVGELDIAYRFATTGAAITDW